MQEEPTIRAEHVPRDPRVGQSIAGRYELVQVLGRGGFGSVFRARDSLLQRFVALKLIDAAVSPDGRERGLREARATAALQHPNVVTLHDAGEDPLGLFLVLELVDAPSLRELLASGPIRGRRAAEIMQQIASALSAAHQLGIVHRDIKPANILVAAGDRVKVADFGIARLLGEGALTVAGSAVGTPAYMSPEQVQGRGVGAPSDLFSCGCVLYEMLTGRQAFRAATVPELWAQIGAGRWERPPVTEVTAEDAPLWRVVERLLQVDGGARGAATDLVNELSGGGLPAAKRPRRWIGYATAGAIITAALAGGIAMWQQRAARSTRAATQNEPSVASLDAGFRNALAGHEFFKEPNLLTSDRPSEHKISVVGRYRGGELLAHLAAAAGWPLVQDRSAGAAGEERVPLSVVSQNWDQVALAVVDRLNLSLSRDGDVWMVESRAHAAERQKRLPMKTVLIPLKNRRDLDNVAAITQKALTPRGGVAVNRRVGGLVIWDVDEGLANARPVVNMLDAESHWTKPVRPRSPYTGAPITLNLRDSDLVDVLNHFSRFSGLSVVVDPSVHGRIDVNLPKVPWDNALEVILRSQGLSFRMENGVMQVAPEQALLDESIIVETLQLHNEAPSFFLSLQPLLGSKGQIVPDDASKTLMLRGPADNVRSLAEVCRNLDQIEPPQRATER